MHIFETPHDFSHFCAQQKQHGKTLGFVPTMGALHAGHLSLVAQSQKENDMTVVSIFVNPAQFGPREDFSAYPRTLEDDCALLRPLHVDAIFVPTPHTMYPQGIQDATKVYVPKLSKRFCGITRPHFFKGVTTVVLRLLNLAQPTRAYFGEKDFQQLTIIRQMVRDLFLPLEVVECPLVRETNGLAMSSRNRYFTPEQREEAAVLFQALTAVKVAVHKAPLSYGAAKSLFTQVLKDHSSFILDYFEAVDPSTLSTQRVIKPTYRLLAAATLHQVRLIDTLQL